MAIGALGASGSLQALQSARAATGQAALTPEQQQQVVRLKQIDQKVHAHEAAHQAAGAGLTSGASYQYVRGPDGRQYAVAGEVKIDVSPAQTPSQTVDKAKRIQAAALAPADPSAQDRAVAAQAAQMAMQAQAELSRANQAGGLDRNAALAAYDNQEPVPAPTLSLFA
ncbi:hypothetical protein EZJ19_03380 [Parasulfuritortus cantonensis]|uniref:SprA-related family protein n=1 Tax=Parasulfuritortus cantonensis TaxID=2528202 RepID=A0A4R1BLA2_9PROT|nr:hypothetical protein EZJ19_03380 [Parasulfuritortus cantonensis]